MTDEQSKDGKATGDERAPPASTRTFDRSRVHAERRGELRPNRWHFRRLVQERVADAECRGLQREALVPSPDLDPMRLVGGLADEYRDTGRAANLARILVVLALWPEQPTEGEFAQPGRYARVSRGCAVETLSLLNRLGAIEANPALEFPDECRVRNLGGVGLDDEVKHTFNRGALGDQQHSHTV